MTELSRRRAITAAQAVAALSLAAWRLLAPTWHPFWQDILFWAALYWLATLFGRESRAWPALTGAVVLGLALIYLSGQMPHMLLVYDLLP